MREIDTSSAALRAADAFARAAALAPEAAPVRPADPARPRFEVGGRQPQSDPKVLPRGLGQPANDDQPAIAVPSDRPSGRSQGGLVGALTAFVAKVLGQAGDGGVGATPSAMLAGQRAYAGAAARTPQPPQAPAPEVISPALPRLSSGRILDLSI